MDAQRLDPSCSALVLVDYQARLMPAIDDGAQVVAQGVRLAQIARVLGIPVVGTEQNPRGLGTNDVDIAALCDRTLTKMHFDACADGLLTALGAARHVVVAGCEAHVCLMQTALGLRRAGLPVWVAADACGSRRASDRSLGLQRLHDAGAVLGSVEMLAFEWLHSCEHPQFKAVLPLLRTR